MATQQLNLSTLPLQQLQQIYQQVDEDIQILTSSYQNLRQAQSKFNGCLDSLSTLTVKNQDKEILVPLTNSLYVPGLLSDTESVIVDVGTGYYVQKNIKDAKTFYSKKITFVKDNLEKLGETITQKNNQKKVVSDVIKYKNSVAMDEKMEERKEVMAN